MHHRSENSRVGRELLVEEIDLEGGTGPPFEGEVQVGSKGRGKNNTSSKCKAVLISRRLSYFKESNESYLKGI